MPSSLSQYSGSGGRRRRTNSRKNKRGGSAGNAGNAGSAGSAWNFVGQTVGSGDTQWNNVFQKGGPFGSEIQSVNGSSPSTTAMSNIASGNAGPMLSGTQNGGKRRKGSRRSKKGGYWGHLLSQAVVPFALWGAQNKFSRRKGLFSSQRSKKNRH